ncbi:MAG: hypothetical protein KF773_03590 [Deltaproteobacteria bacterium]|nr:hypothetical protein [Deltaproteobacteria bacterium]
MKEIIRVEDVATRETRGGNLRYVLRDDQHREYTTFRTQIGEEARSLAGRQAEIEFHEEHRGDYTNVYLDAIEPVDAGDAGELAGGGAAAPVAIRQAAWQVAAALAPWLPKGDVLARDDAEAFERLRALVDRIADDIRYGGRS